MLIGFRHNQCIWCGKPFLIKGFRPRGGEVARSEEHIIPANIFGRLKTNDVCTSCNSRLGSEVDDRLLNDFDIFQAGLDAGYRPDQLLPSFRVCGNTPDGEQFEYRVRNGQWRLKPSFHETGFKIGSVNGSSTREDLRNAKRKMLRVVREDKRLAVSASEAEKFIEDLFNRFLERQSQHAVYQEEIKQGLRGRPIPSTGTISRTTHPWETQWAIAKTLYEAGLTLLPEGLLLVIHSGLQQMRRFVDERKPQTGIFLHKTLAHPAEAQHEIQILVRGSKLRFVCRLFGREEWSLPFDVLRRNKPAPLNDYEIQVINYSKAQRTPSVQIIENGRLAEWNNP